MVMPNLVMLIPNRRLMGQVPPIIVPPTMKRMEFGVTQMELLSASMMDLNLIGLPPLPHILPKV